MSLTTHWGHRYYICMNVKPPQVSSTHPLGPTQGTNSPVQEYPSPEIRSVTTLPESASLGSSPGYPRSSSVQSPSSGLSFAQQLYASAVKSSINTSLPSAAESPMAQLDIPTLPNPPPPTAAVRPLPVLVAPQLPNLSNSSIHHINYDASELYGTSLTSRSRPHGFHSSPSLTRHSTTITRGSMNYPSARRSQSYQLAAFPSQERLHPHRASTLSAGISKTSGTPTFVTTARPPTHLSAKSHATLSVQTAAAPHPQLQSSITLLPATPSLPPTINSPPTTALHNETHPFMSPAQSPLSPTSVSLQFVQTHHQQAQAQAQSVVNVQQQQAAAYALQVPNQPVVFSGNTQQPTQPSAQGLVSTYQNTYSVQPQALSVSEQQYQHALQVQMQQINAAAAQEVAHAQQNTQNILQAAYQQQQMQQLQQIQATSQYLVFQQDSPAGPPVEQGPSRLDTWLTGVNSVLSTFADAATSYTSAGGGVDYIQDSSMGSLSDYNSLTAMGLDATLNSTYVIEP